jgi:DNA-binding SARP family transcriptional activator
MTGMKSLTLTLFGGFEARLGGREALVLPRRKARALLAYLALRPGFVCPREALMALLWGDVPAEQARHSLRQALVDLRRALPNGKTPALLAEGDSLSLNPDRVEVDVAVFEELANQSTRKALERAAALYTGDLLVGLTLREPPFEDWLRAERTRLRERVLHVLRRILSVEIAADDLEPAVQTAIRFLTIEPLSEPVHRTLMQVYDRLGRRSAALRQFHLCADLLQRELGVAPELETRRLYETLAPKARAVAGTRPVRLPRGNGGTFDASVDVSVTLDHAHSTHGCRIDGP